MVNDSPVLNTILDDSIDEDSVFTYELTAMDVDNSQFIFSASIEENGSVEISDSTLTVIPDLNFNGNLEINVTVSDGELSDSNSFNLFINAINDAPILSDIQNQVINEDEVFSYDLITLDIDSDELSYIVSVGNNASVDIFDSELIITPFQDYNGIIPVNVSVSDGEFLDSDSFEIDVQPINDNPIATQGINSITNEDQIVSIILTGNDIDDDDLVFSILTSTLNGSLSLTDNFVSYTPFDNFNGTDSFTFNVSDGSLSDSATVEILINPINDAPIAGSISSITDEDTDVSIELFGEDIDSATLSFLINEESDNGTVIINGSEALFVPNENFYGETSFKYVVTDGELVSDFEVVDITVNPVNDPPEILETSIELDEDSTITIELNVFDVDSDSFEISIFNQPTQGSLSAINNTLLTFEYTPDQNFFGDDLLEYRIYDGVDFSNISPINILVNPINDSPTLSAILSQSVDEDNRFEYVLSASDIDDTELSFSAVLDDNGSVSITDSTLTVIPNLNYNGTIQVDVSVSDGQLLDNNNFTLTVIPVNDAPELSVLDDSEIEEDNTLTIYYLQMMLMVIY